MDIAKIDTYNELAVGKMGKVFHTKTFPIKDLEENETGLFNIECRVNIVNVEGEKCVQFSWSYSHTSNKELYSSRCEQRLAK